MESDTYPHYDGQSLTDLAFDMKRVQDSLTAAKAESSRLQKEWDYLRKQAIPSLMDDQGIQNITIKGLGRVGMRSDMYANTPAENRERLWEWLRQEGAEALITQTVNGSTLKSLFRERIKQGEELPQDIVNIEPYTYVTITKAS